MAWGVSVHKRNLQALIKIKEGLVFTSDVDEARIPREYLAIFVKEGSLIKMGTGIYVTHSNIYDEGYCLQHKYANLIFSHLTALTLHGLYDKTPSQWQATLPENCHYNKLNKKGVVIYNVKQSVYNLGLTHKKTSFGREIRVYDVERTICDLLRNRKEEINQIGRKVLIDGIHQHTIDIHQLAVYAQQFFITKKINNYLQILTEQNDANSTQR